MNNGGARFFKIQERFTRGNLCRNNFIQRPSKVTMEPSQCVFCNANGTNNSKKLKKEKIVD